MENRINVAELLKDCPKGMELDCTIYNKVTLINVDDREDIVYPIRVFREDGNTIALTKYGQYTDADFAKCVIFPKGKTTWEGFRPPFKDGDIISGCYFDATCIFKDEGNIKGTIDYYCGISGSDELLIKDVKNQDEHFGYIDEYKLATEEEKAILFDAIKANGYKWNEETKNLEKLPKFKVGDKIQHMGYKVKITEVNIEDECYEYESMFAKGIGSIEFSEQDNWELIPNKFDISALGPFDKVLVRGSDNGIWCASIFSHTWKYKYFCVDTWHNQCIPYEGNEHLLGTTHDCDEFYKTWLC